MPRWIVTSLALCLGACGSTETAGGPPTGGADEPAPSRARVEPAPAAPAPPIEGPEPSEPAGFGPSAPTLSDASGECVLGRPTEVVTTGRGRLRPVRVAMGSAGPMLAWLSRDVVHTRPLAADGTARGPEHEVGIPVSSDMNAPTWRDAGFWLEAVDGGFVVITHVGRGRRWNLHLRAVGPDGAPRGEALTVPTGRAQEDSYVLRQSEHGLYLLHPHGARLERYTIGAGGLVRELLGETEGGDGKALVLIDETRHAVLVQRRRAFLFRLDDGSEVPLASFPEPARMLDAGYDGERAVFVYETYDAGRRPSWTVTATLDGSVGRPVSIGRDTPLPEPFTDRARVFAVERQRPESDSPSDTYSAIERQNAAAWRLGDALESTVDDVAWTGRHFLGVGGGLRRIEAFTLTCAGDTEPPAASEAEAWFGVPRYPGARELCDQHVSGASMHIVWTGFATPDPIERVRAFYERRRGEATLDGDGDAFSIRLPGDPDHVVSVSRADGAHPSCDVAHGPADRTYFVVSTSTGAR